MLGSAARPDLIHWSTQWPQGYSPFDSYALRTPDGWVLIDPERPDDAVLERLRSLIDRPPVATVLNSDGHERACYAVKERWKAPVWGPIPVESERGSGYDGTPDKLYQEGDGQRLPGGLIPIRVNGLWGGDHALFWKAPSGESVLFSADLLNGQVNLDLARPDHFRRPDELNFGSRPGYVDRHPDRAALAASLRRLLQEPIDLICGSHATPFRRDPKDAIQRLLAGL